ncbi:MAG: peptidase T, partial [Alistipes sp.]|nr:peptidase T [Candidatus Minthomonas equi]
YVAVDTQSNKESLSQPSTNKQFNLLQMLSEELKAMGVPEVSLDRNGYLMASIPSNIDRKVPALGLIAHVDTSPDAPGCGIHPQIIENYDGNDIILNPSGGMKIAVQSFPEIARYKGQTLITTDGTTLLGADDKAGVAEIMTAAQYIMEHPEVKHGKICIGFTPDEEIGRGVDHFDTGKFGADFAYTFDGGEIGELEYENFNAASAKIHISGRNIHPGYAKDKMKNAILIASEFNSLLPVHQRPEYTEGYDGFFHIVKFSGVVEDADIQYIIRDHNRTAFEKKKEIITQVADFINARYGEGTATLEIKDQYYNMRQEVEKHMEIVDIARRAMSDAGITPKVKPIRGGTDGARLSFMGLPCPNIFAGGHNFHGKLEFVPLQSMEKATEVALNIIKEVSLS